MKVFELIQKLQSCDPQLEVAIAGYEGGYSLISNVTKPQSFVENVNNAWYYGPHEMEEYIKTIATAEELDSKTTFQAVIVY